MEHRGLSCRGVQKSVDAPKIMLVGAWQIRLQRMRKGKAMNRVFVEIGKNVAMPVGRRIGTALAAYLLAQGIPSGMVDQFVLGLGVTGALALDIISAYVTRRAR